MKVKTIFAGLKSTVFSLKFMCIAFGDINYNNYL